MDVLCDRAQDLIRGRFDDQLECDVGAVGTPDLATVDALARVELTVRRLGSGIRLRGASVDLLELLAFCGVPLESVDELINAAESSLDRAKARGGDRVEAWTQGEEKT